ncbi:MAG TPA: DUF6398 domain-containing protein [Longimicrobium sp.]|nr:DUF6398 domain-containing protein [Longimicrobium sp.]
MAANPELRSVPHAVRPRFEEIVRLTDPVCREHLDDDYAELAREAAATLARKRPSPLLQAQARSWACGIVYAIGRVNFLFDKSEKPYLSAPELCALFNVSPATGAAKARVVMDALNTRMMDPRWSTTSMIDRNPMVWFIEINGLVVDARQLPAAIQEELVRVGAIPYVHEPDAS